MSTVRILIFFVLSNYVAGSSNYSCINQVPDSKIKLSPLPDIFKVSIEFVDMIRDFSADFIEFGRKTNEDHLSVVTCTNGTQTFKTIYNRTSKTLTFVNGSATLATCQVSPYASGRPYIGSFFFPDDLIKVDQPMLGLYDLMSLVQNTSLSIDPDNHDHDHGIPVDHYVGCLKSPDSKYWMEFKVCVVKDGFKLNGVNDPKLKLPTRLELEVYDVKPAAKEPKSYFSSSYELFAYKTDSGDLEENVHLPPRGVFCSGQRNNSKPLPRLPETFSLNVELVDHNDKHVDSSRLYYDAVDGVVIVDFTRASDLEPFTVGVTDKLPAGRYLAVQDFKSGLQYVVEPVSHRCVAALAIPGGAGTAAQAGSDKRLIGMKDAFALIFGLPQKEFSYVGTRFDDGIPLEIWNARVTKAASTKGEQPSEFVYEIWFSTENWDSDNVGGKLSNVPVYLKTYLTGVANRAVTVQRFHNFAAYDRSQSSVHLMQYNVFECRDAHAFYMLQLNDTMDNIRSFGVDNVASRLRDEIANRSGASEFRLGLFSFFEAGKLATNVWFALASVFKEPGAKTTLLTPEVDAKVATKQLNDSIQADQMNLSVDVAGKKLHLSVVRGSALLKVDPSALVGGRVPPIIVAPRTGYSGGAMFTMSLFMLLIGGAAGGFVALVYFRRNRGGVAYQIYE